MDAQIIKMDASTRETMAKEDKYLFKTFIMGVFTTSSDIDEIVLTQMSLNGLSVNINACNE